MSISKSPVTKWYVTEYPVEGSFAVTDGYEIFATIIGGKTIGDECDLASRIAKLPDLERERDESRHEIQGWKNKFNCAVDMGARAENELAKLREAAKSVVEIWETPPWKIGETPSKAITQLRDAIGYED